MRKANKLGTVATALLLVSAFVLPAAAADLVTVGRFVQEVAKIRNLNATDARIAADSLRAAGVRLPSDMDLNRRLTEADVADIARRVGLKVTTSQPEAPFSEGQMDQFFNSFAAELGQVVDDRENNSVRDRDPNKFDPKSKGKGKGKAKGHRTATEPE